MKTIGIGLAVALAASPALALERADLSRYLFVPNRASAEVSVIDTRSERVVAQLPVGRTPHQIVVSDVLGVLVASNIEDDTVSIIDLESETTLATLPLDREPEHMQLSPDGRLVAVGNIKGDSVSLVSLTELREVARIEGLVQPHNLTFDPTGKRLYVANLGADFVSVIDVEEGRVVEEIPVGEPKLVALAARDEAYQGIINVTATPDGRLGFAAYGEGNRLAMLDLRTGANLKTLELGELPWRAYTTADGRFMLVPNNGDETISVISTASLEEVARLEGGPDMVGINAGWFETTAFVLSRGADKLIVLDLVNLAKAGEIPLPGTPETGVVSPDGTRLYVALSSTDQVAVIDTRRRALIGLIDGLGEEPWGTFMVGSINYCH